MTMLDNEQEAVTRSSRTVYLQEALEPLRPAHVFRNEIINRDSPYFEGRDIAAGVSSATIMLGPLLAYAVGWGA